MSNKNPVPFNFTVFDSSKDNEEENKQEVQKNHSDIYRFEIKKKSFVQEPTFHKTDETFAPMFTEHGINKKSYSENIEEYRQKRKAEIDSEIEKYFDEKKLEADNILKEAEEKSKQLFSEKEKEGFEKGYKEGFEKGYKETLEKEGHNFEIFKALIDRLSSEEKKLIKNFENKIAELIINFAEAVIKKEISVNSEEILKNNIKHALNKLVDKSEVTIYVSPENYDFLQQNIDKIGETFEIENLKVHRLDKVSPGGAIVESSFGSVDATTETQINEFKQLILNNN